MSNCLPVSQSQQAAELLSRFMTIFGSPIQVGKPCGNGTQEGGVTIHLIQIPGGAGKTPYQYALENGYTGTESDFIQMWLFGLSPGAGGDISAEIDAIFGSPPVGDYDMDAFIRTDVVQTLSSAERNRAYANLGITAGGEPVARNLAWVGSEKVLTKAAADAQKTAWDTLLNDEEIDFAIGAIVVAIDESKGGATNVMYMYRKGEDLREWFGVF